MKEITYHERKVGVVSFIQHFDLFLVPCTL